MTTCDKLIKHSGRQVRSAFAATCMLNPIHPRTVQAVPQKLISRQVGPGSTTVACFQCTFISLNMGRLSEVSAYIRGVTKVSCSDWGRSAPSSIQPTGNHEETPLIIASSCCKGGSFRVANCLGGSLRWLACGRLELSWRMQIPLRQLWHLCNSTLEY